MKFFLTCLSTLSFLSLVHGSDITADSSLGQELLKQSRFLGGGNNNNNQQQQQQYSPYKWMQTYSLKFQGCSQISQWNDYVQEDADVRISTKRLARYRLCPTDSCSSTNAAGCTAGYGDYIVDLHTFVYYFMKNKEYTKAYNCNYALNYACPCNNNGGNNNNGGQCDNTQCLKTNGYEYCINYNANNGGNQENDNGFVVDNYFSCSEFKSGDVSYYIGPYCNNQGNRILMGLFSDDTCTTILDSSKFDTMTGMALPYHNVSMVDTECTSCKDEVIQNNKNNYAVYDGTGVRQLCSKNYVSSGKCEERLESGITINTNGCTYMDGIKMTRTNGVIFSTVPSKSKVASAFIGIFCVCFLILGAYVYYLKSKLDRVKVNLSD